MGRMRGQVGRQTGKEAKVKLSFINNVTGLSLKSGDSVPGRPTLQTHGHHLLKTPWPQGLLEVP